MKPSIPITYHDKLEELYKGGYTYSNMRLYLVKNGISTSRQSVKRLMDKWISSGRIPYTRKVHYNRVYIR